MSFRQACNAIAAGLAGEYRLGLGEFRDWQAYCESPTPTQRTRLASDFDRMFLKKTDWPELNEALKKIHGKQSVLLLVLHPHNLNAGGP